MWKFLTALMFLLTGFIAKAQQNVEDSVELRRQIAETIAKADEGNSAAQLICAINYLNESEGFCKNDTLVVHYLQLILKNPDPSDDSPMIAAYMLADYYFRGEVVEQNDEMGFALEKRAAEAGFNPARFMVGYCYEKGKGVEPNMAYAKEWYLLAAEHGDADALINMCRFCHEGWGGEQNDDEALKWLKAAVDQENARAQLLLAMSYYGNYLNIEPDISKAVYWYRKSAEQGNVVAQFNMGYMYIYGEKVSQDFSKGIYWMTKAAEQGFADAQLNIGSCYWQGLGVAKDKQVAFGWWRQAAEQGNIEAQYVLGTELIEESRNIAGKKRAKEISTEGIYYLEMAAKAGNIDAPYFLALVYSLGIGVKENRKLSNYWYGEAARCGNTKAIEWCHRYNIPY